MNSGFVVFWLNSDFESRFVYFETNQMSLAMKEMEDLRKDPCNQFITMAAQTANQVGKMGVAGVADGKLPNGEDYTYTKRDALSQRTKND